MKTLAIVVCVLCLAAPVFAQTFTLNAVSNCPGLGYSHDVVLLNKTYYIQFVSGAWSPVSDDSQYGGYAWCSTVTYYDYGTGQTGTLGGLGFFTSSPAAEGAGLGIYPIQGHGSVVSFYLQETGPTAEVCADNRGGVTLEFIVPTGAGTLPPATMLELRPNYPNPFTGTTEFEVNLPRQADVTLDVFDVAGRRVHTARLSNQPAGWNTVAFDGRDDIGRELVSGIYFAKVSALGQTVTRKIVLVR